MELQRNFGGWSKKSFGGSGETFTVATSEDGRSIVVKTSHQIGKVPVQTVIFGKMAYRVKKIGIQARDIIRQIRSDFKKLEPVGWRPDIGFFLRYFLSLLAENKADIVRKLESSPDTLLAMLENEELFISEKGNVFWLKPDKAVLQPIMHFYETYWKKPARDFFLKFIEEQTEDQNGVLMLKVELDFWVER